MITKQGLINKIEKNLDELTKILENNLNRVSFIKGIKEFYTLKFINSFPKVKADYRFSGVINRDLQIFSKLSETNEIIKDEESSVSSYLNLSRTFDALLYLAYKLTIIENNEEITAAVLNLPSLHSLKNKYLEKHPYYYY